MLALKRVVSLPLRQILDQEHVAKTELASCMKTNRASLNRTLDPSNRSLTVASLEKAAVVGGVDGGLLRADVVRLDGDAGMLGSLGDKATASKEIDEGWKEGAQEFFSTVFASGFNLGVLAARMK